MDVFCKIINGELPCNSPYEDDLVKCIMDLNPNSPGHMLIITKKHFESVMEIDEETIKKVHEVAKKFSEKMMNVFDGCDGIALINNYGKPQIVKHFHLHLVPTYHEGEPSMTQEEACELLKD